ncbi:uncharacterized protein TRUGW13939_05148 [Talaromyces rugulosus]|uniref:Uncharacterized protein n=1 Tax=Talaromyces rugulosus TaxID=121627 RepID=A0A7H8QWH6_TALRU|nr:uncharacterized protein TRUGW13939_05148 [Talaromyces rugulosus]QKX58028.1 hypothetical protein TRUGW13939_05148 [Talaromyces rugulosus]
MASSRVKSTLSLFQKEKKYQWPNPESSIGKFCGTKKGKYTYKRCWKAVGPAQEALSQVATEIDELLAEKCGPVPSSCLVQFDIFMIGAKPATAVPYIMFSCTRYGPRKEALTVVQKSEILNRCPRGIELGQWDKPPTIQNLQPLGSSTESVGTGEITGMSRVHLSPVFDNKPPWKFSAMQLKLYSSHHNSEYLSRGTVGSILEIADKRFYVAPAHIFSERNYSPHMMSDDDIQEGDSDCEFCGFDDEDERIAEEDEVEFLSQYSVTPDSSDIETESNPDDEYYSSDSEYEDSPSVQYQEEEPVLNTGSSLIADLSPLKTDDTADLLHRVSLDIMMPCITSIELDFSLIEVNKNDHITEMLPTFSRYNVCKVGPGDVDVTAMTGSGELLTGILSGRPVYTRLPNTRKFQETFEVEISGRLQPGDCGSIVRNARTGDIYGHIFAGCVESKIAYIIPAVNVLEEIERIFNVFPGSNQAMEIIPQCSLPDADSDTKGEHAASEDLFELTDKDACDSIPRMLVASKRVLTYEDYTIWISSLYSEDIEVDAARSMLDEVHDALPQLPGEPHSYTLGSIGDHNVVIACTSGDSAATSQMLSTFPNIRFCFLVGTDSSLPTTRPSDIRLGDVVVSMRCNCHGGGIKYNFGKTYSIGRAQKKGLLDAPPETLLAAVSRLQEAYKTGDAQVSPSLSRLTSRPTAEEVQFKDPSEGTGQWLEADQKHKHSEEQLEECEHCHNDIRTIQCCHRCNGKPMIHYGLITSGNQVTKDSDIHNLFEEIEKRTKSYASRWK